MLNYVIMYQKTAGAAMHFGGNLMKLQRTIPVIFAICVVLCGCASQNADIGPKREVAAYSEHVFKVSKPPGVDITSDSGNIEIYSWDRKEVKFEVTKKIRGIREKDLLEKELEGFKVDIEQQGDDIFYQTSYKGHMKNQIDRAVDLKIFIPKKIKSIDCRLDLGKIKIYDDLECELNMTINMANVDINRFEGKINLDADMCDLRISNGRLDADSKVKINMGSIQIKGEYQGGSYDFDTNMGNVELNIPAGLKVSLETVGTVEANEIESGDYPVALRIRSGMGKIALKKYTK